MRVRELANTAEAADDEIDLSQIWQILRRRQRLVLLTAAAVIAATALITTGQRLFTPTYQGGFTLLIVDPVNSNDNSGSAASVGGNGPMAGSVIESLALNGTRSDIPNLIELLKSPVLLGPIAQRHKTSIAALASQLEIKSGGSKQKEANGILSVSLTGRFPQTTQKLLSDLAATYLQIALVQRQQRLADGIKFLDQQAPTLQQKTAELQQQLALFRERTTLLQPSEEGAALKSKMLEQSDGIRSLHAERSRLLSSKQSIRDGSLTARGFQLAIGGNGTNSSGSSQGLLVVDANQSLLEQLSKLDDQLAEARAKYTANSSMVKGLLARRNQMLPLLRRNQLEAVNGALRLNQVALAAADHQQSLLKGSFKGQPQLIKQYEAIQQKLQIANDNLAAFIKAKENFQLEIAQRTVPWKVIAPPIVEASPIKPSIPRNLALGVLLGLVAGAAVGLLRDRLDHVFHYPGEVSDDLKQTLLGHIPFVAVFEGVREGKRFVLDTLEQPISNPAQTAG